MRRTGGTFSTILWSQKGTLGKILWCSGSTVVLGAPALMDSSMSMVETFNLCINYESLSCGLIMSGVISSSGFRSRV